MAVEEEATQPVHCASSTLSLAGKIFFFFFPLSSSRIRFGGRKAFCGGDELTQDV